MDVVVDDGQADVGEVVEKVFAVPRSCSVVVRMWLLLQGKCLLLSKGNEGENFRYEENARVVLRQQQQQQQQQLRLKCSRRDLISKKDEHSSFLTTT